MLTRYRNAALFFAREDHLDLRGGRQWRNQTMKDILIHIRDFRRRTPAAQFGVRLAATLGAAVTAVYACPQPLYIAPSAEPGLITAAIENTRTLVSEAIRSKQSFVDWAALHGVRDIDWLVAQGNIGDALSQASAYHDLLVLDHPDEDRGSAWDLPAPILKADIPCIVLPHTGVHSDRFERVAIGWNASPQAMRAVHAALPFLQGRQVLLMHGDEREKYPALEWESPFNIVGYLERRGIAVEQRSIDAGHDEAGAALLDEAMKFRADLLVMGAYGRSRFSEWMLGGATRHVLAWSDIPVLLRH